MFQKKGGDFGRRLIYFANTGAGFIFSVEDLESETFSQYQFFRLKKAGDAGHWNTFSKRIILEDRVSPDNIVKLLL